MEAGGLFTAGGITLAGGSDLMIWGNDSKYYRQECHSLIMSAHNSFTYYLRLQLAHFLYKTAAGGTQLRI